MILNERLECGLIWVFRIGFRGYFTNQVWRELRDRKQLENCSSKLSHGRGVLASCDASTHGIRGRADLADYFAAVGREYRASQKTKDEKDL